MQHKLRKSKTPKMSDIKAKEKSPETKEVKPEKVDKMFDELFDDIKIFDIKEDNL